MNNNKCFKIFIHYATFVFLLFFKIKIMFIRVYTFEIIILYFFIAKDWNHRACEKVIILRKYKNSGCDITSSYENIKKMNWKYTSVYNL